MSVTIEDAIEYQAKIDSGHVHVVWIGPDGWVVAHTDDEREEGLEVMTDCDLNDWLDSFTSQPEPTGWYVALEEDWDGWELIPVDQS